MPATEEISESLIRDNIIRAVGDVFGTMLSRPVELQGSAAIGETAGLPPAQPAEAAPLIVGTVGFLGEIDGLIYIYLDVDFAKTLTEAMLGADTCGEEAVNDAIGELTNMIVGVFKNGLCDAGFPCKLTIPSILRGRNFRVEPIGSARRYIYRFQSQGRRVVADILMKNEP
ncbi:MAG: chemotaxis protein CheX [Opitutaceae bacterium]